MFEAVLMLAAPLAVLAGTVEAPYSRLTVNKDEYYLYTTQNEVYTLSEAYKEARLQADERCPKAELIDCASIIDMRDTEGMPQKQELFRNTYVFVFRNPERGVFIHDTAEIITVVIYAPGGIVKFDFSDATWEQTGFTALEEPLKIDDAAIQNIALAQAELSREDIEEITIAARSVSLLSTDPGGDTWSVQISANGSHYNYIVNIAEGTATEEQEAKMRLNRGDNNGV